MRRHLFSICFIGVLIAATSLRADQALDTASLGIRGDGRTLVTAQLQVAINQAAAAHTILKITTGIYLIDAASGLSLPSGSRLELAADAILRAIPSSIPHSQVIKIHQVNDVHVSGGQIEGDREGHLSPTGEWGHGIDIRSSSQIVIRKIGIRKCWGDGVYIGKDASDIQILEVACAENRRQGISITSGKNLLVQNCIFEKTSGTAPACGIDVEPNRGETVDGCQIVTCRILNNAGGGIQAGPAIRDQGTASVKGLVVERCVLEGNGEGAPPRFAIHITGCENTRILNNQLRNNLGIGIGLTSARQTVVTGNLVTGTRATTNRSDSALLLDRDTETTVDDNQFINNEGFGIFQWKSRTTVGRNHLKGNARGESYR